MRFDIPETMHAVLLTGHGGPEKLEYRSDVKVPRPNRGEVLIRVGATAVNNTDINTRIGWYSKQVKSATQAGNSTGFDQVDNEDASWSGIALQFPLIQGADCCGRVVAVGEDVDPSRIGQRVLVRNMLRTPVDGRPFECWTYGSDINGAFAQYTVAPDADIWAINSELSDVELASFPCSYSTAEVLVQRASVKGSDTVLITGASGGVGSAAVQLVKCRGARVIAIASNTKREEILSLGADQVVDRGADLIESLGKNSVSVVLDLVGGPDWPSLLQVLRTGGRYAVAGAIAGPLVELDLRTLYLKDLTFFGCTWQDDQVFDSLVEHIEASRIRPLVSKVYPLSEIVQAQADFVEKRHTGKLVLVPPQEYGHENR
ncbi:alcohol dehydrogenase family protein [Pseudomonas sp. C11]|uniref:alcohol dehydrogenase family protein n=1 Tax=Pseudomonas sp. C11 TaxID=3075550 RepID=UPI002AFE4745|nr:alcohol dehydrogenase family protein [Pseudomonas sp. C11]